LHPWWGCYQVVGPDAHLRADPIEFGSIRPATDTTGGNRPPAELSITRPMTERELKRIARYRSKLARQR
jgi:hypothetical protein